MMTKQGRAFGDTHNQFKDESTDVYGDKREEDSSSSSSSPPQHSRERALPAWLWWRSRIYLVSVPYRAGW